MEEQYVINLQKLARLLVITVRDLKSLFTEEMERTELESRFLEVVKKTAAITSRLSNLVDDVPPEYSTRASQAKVLQHDILLGCIDEVRQNVLGLIKSGRALVQNPLDFAAVQCTQHAFIEFTVCIQKLLSAAEALRGTVLERDEKVMRCANEAAIALRNLLIVMAKVGLKKVLPDDSTKKTFAKSASIFVKSLFALLSLKNSSSGAERESEALAEEGQRLIALANTIMKNPGRRGFHLQLDSVKIELAKRISEFVLAIQRGRSNSEGSNNTQPGQLPTYKRKTRKTFGRATSLQRLASQSKTPTKDLRSDVKSQPLRIAREPSASSSFISSAELFERLNDSSNTSAKEATNAVINVLRGKMNGFDALWYKMPAREKADIFLEVSNCLNPWLGESARAGSPSGTLKHSHSPRSDDEKAPVSPRRQRPDVGTKPIPLSAGNKSTSKASAKTRVDRSVSIMATITPQALKKGDIVTAGEQLEKLKEVKSLGQWRRMSQMNTYRGSSFGRIFVYEGEEKHLLSEIKNPMCAAFESFILAVNTYVTSKTVEQASLSGCAKTIQQLLLNLISASIEGTGTSSSSFVEEKKESTKVASEITAYSMTGVIDTTTVKAASGFHAALVIDSLKAKLSQAISDIKTWVLHLTCLLNTSAFTQKKLTSSQDLLQACAICRGAARNISDVLDVSETYKFLLANPPEELLDDVALQLSSMRGGGVLDTNIWMDPCPVPESSADITTANLNVLVQLLTSSTSVDTAFSQTFFATLQSFTTPAELFSKLKQRYAAPKHIGEKERQTIQWRVAVVMKHWVESQFYDFDDALIKRLYAFIDTMAKDEKQKTIAGLLRNEVQKKVKDKEEKQKFLTVEWSSCWKVPSWVGKVQQTPLSMFLAQDPEEIAKQLTLIDYSLFKAIEPVELLSQSWNKPTMKHRSRNVVRLISRLNHLSEWVATLVVAGDKKKTRTAVLTKVYQVAKFLRKCKNFNSLMGILSGCNMSGVHRLKHTQAGVPRKLANSFEKMEKMMAPQKSFAQYRAVLHDTTPPLVPFLGMYLTDLTFIGDGNPDAIGSLINFKKRVLTHRVLQEVKVYQQCPLEIVPQEPLHTFLQVLPAIDEQTLFSISQVREPKNAAFSDIL